MASISFNESTGRQRDERISVDQLTAGVPRPIRLRELFAGGSAEGHKIERIHAAPLSLFTQNMALLVAPSRYRGEDRASAIRSLVQNLRRERPDVVGLCEVFDDNERAAIRGGMRDVYPYFLEGPDEADIESDGGLLLLSKHPFTAHHETVYRDATSEERVVNKGALHAQIAVPDHPTQYHVFLTHLQNPDPSLPDLSTGWGTVEKQLTHLKAFVENYRDFRRPAFLMGDLNVDGLSVDQYTTLRRTLEFDEDLWATAGDPDESGITVDSKRAFVVRAASPVGSTTREMDRSTMDPQRHREGSRLDYVLLWRGTRYWPVTTDAEVVVWQTRENRDLSDHYGLATTQTGLRKLATKMGSISRVTARLRGFRCLYETGGIPKDFDVLGIPTAGSRISESDEIELKLGCGGVRDGTRFGYQTRKAPEMSGVDTGDIRSYGDQAPTVTLTDPGDRLYLTVRGKEVDTFSDDDIGGAQRYIDRHTLLWHKGRSFDVFFPLRKAGGEYSVNVRISVE